MLVAIGDTHETAGHALEGAALEAVRAADLVVHTGDFTTEAVYDAVAAEADDLVAVAGNNDRPGLCERVPETRTFDALGRRFVALHGHGKDDTARSLLARQEGADVVLVGHSHRPTIRSLGEATLVNPGSYADPRWNEAAFGVLEASGGDLEARLVTPEGATLRRERV